MTLEEVTSLRENRTMATSSKDRYLTALAKSETISHLVSRDQKNLDRFRKIPSDIEDTLYVVSEARAGGENVRDLRTLNGVGHPTKARMKRGGIEAKCHINGQNHNTLSCPHPATVRSLARPEDR
jgi:hypothetical protein